VSRGRLRHDRVHSGRVRSDTSTANRC